MHLIANLDCERAWAGLPPEPAPVRARLSALGALMAVLARPGDVVWTCAPLREEQIAPKLAECGASFVSGALPDDVRSGDAAAWGVTEDVQALTGGDAAASARANDRRTQIDWSARRGIALPGAREIPSVAQLHAHLADGGAAASATGHWVLKAPHGTAGRARLRGSGVRLRDEDRPRFDRLLAAHGSLVFEPWVDVVAEFGVTARTDPDGVRVESLHRQFVRGGGAVAAIAPFDGTPRESDALRVCAEWIGDELRGLGYAGPFGIDAYRYRDAEGREQFNALGEINARMTFGRIAHAAVARLGSPAMSLVLGTAAAGRDAGPAVVPLLCATPDRDVAAWLAP